jgi:hypothetical protein
LIKFWTPAGPYVFSLVPLVVWSGDYVWSGD